MQVEIGRRDSGDQHGVMLRGLIASPKADCIPRAEWNGLSRVRGLVGVDGQLAHQRGARATAGTLGALRYAVHEIARSRPGERRLWSGDAGSEGGLLEQRD